MSSELRLITGVLPAALKAAKSGRTLILPRDNGAEAALVGGATAHGAFSLLEVCAFLRGAAQLPVATGIGTTDIAGTNSIASKWIWRTYAANRTRDVLWRLPRAATTMRFSLVPGAQARPC